VGGGRARRGKSKFVGKKVKYRMEEVLKKRTRGPRVQEERGTTLAFARKRIFPAEGGGTF